MVAKILLLDEVHEMTAEEEIKAMLNAKANEYEESARTHNEQAEKHQRVAAIAQGKASKLRKLVMMVDEP